MGFAGFPSFRTYRILPPRCAPHLEIAISPHAPASVQRVITSHTILRFAHVFAHGIHPHLRFPDRWRKVRVEVHLPGSLKPLTPDWRDITELRRKGLMVIHRDISTTSLPSGDSTIDLPNAMSSKSFLCGCVRLCQILGTKGTINCSNLG